MHLIDIEFSLKSYAKLCNPFQMSQTTETEELTPFSTSFKNSAQFYKSSRFISVWANLSVLSMKNYTSCHLSYYRGQNISFGRQHVISKCKIPKCYHFLITGTKFLRRHTPCDASCPVLTDQQQIPSTSR